MSITIGNCTFEGPYPSPASLEDQPGLYAVFCRWQGDAFLIDVGESASVKTSVENHDRRKVWKRRCQGTLGFAVCYTPDFEESRRMMIEREIRRAYPDGVPLGGS